MFVTGPSLFLLFISPFLSSDNVLDCITLMMFAAIVKHGSSAVYSLMMGRKMSCRRPLFFMIRKFFVRACIHGLLRKSYPIITCSVSSSTTIAVVSLYTLAFSQILSFINPSTGFMSPVHPLNASALCVMSC